MNTETPQLVIFRVFDAPRELVYRAFTDPDHLAAWWGPDGRTRLEIRQWLPQHLAHPNEEGWLQAFTKLDATLMKVQAVAANHREVRHGKADLPDERVA
jgi:hypothetical protein